jgi:hypothetical protein
MAILFLRLPDNLADWWEDETDALGFSTPQKALVQLLTILRQRTEAGAPVLQPLLRPDITVSPVPGE